MCHRAWLAGMADSTCWSSEKRKLDLFVAALGVTEYMPSADLRCSWRSSAASDGLSSCGTNTKSTPRLKGSNSEAKAGVQRCGVLRRLGAHCCDYSDQDWTHANRSYK